MSTSIHLQLEAHMFTEKRKRRDNKDEFKAAEKTNKVFSDRIKELAKGRKRPMRAVALAKLKFRPRPKRMYQLKSFQSIIFVKCFRFLKVGKTNKS